MESYRGGTDFTLDSYPSWIDSNLDECYRIDQHQTAITNQQIKASRIRKVRSRNRAKIAKASRKQNRGR